MGGIPPIEPPAPRGQMNTTDWKSLGKAVLKYFSPVILVFLLALQQGVPLKQALYLVYAGLLQLAINFVSKLNDN